MTEQSSMHLYLNWTKERIDEMDAALASLEVKASQAKADSKEKADEMIADLKKRRDEFQALLKTQAESGEAAWARAKTELDKQWNGFEAQVQTYFESAGKQIEQQQATFKDIAAAQAKAWREAADKFKLRGGQSGCGPTRRSRCRASANEVRCFRSRSALAKAQPGGKRAPGPCSALHSQSRARHSITPTSPCGTH